MSNKSLLSSVATATVGAMSLAQTANAALVVDLRVDPAGYSGTGAGAVVSGVQNSAAVGATFTNSKTVTISTTSPIVIYAYARVTGETSADEGLQSATFAVQSLIQNAGITGSLTAASRKFGWAGSGANNGSSSNLSTDGLGDWGSLATLNSSTGTVYRARTTVARSDEAANPIDFGVTAAEDAGNVSPGTSSHIDANGGEEFLIGAFVFTPTATPNGSSIQYNIAFPAVGSVAAGTWWEDSTNYTTVNPANGSKVPSNGTYTAGTGITFVTVPEPTTLGLAGLAGLGLLRRRRA